MMLRRSEMRDYRLLRGMDKMMKNNAVLEEKLIKEVTCSNYGVFGGGE